MGRGMPFLRIIQRQASILSPWSQVLPTSISQKMTPSAHTSLFSEQRLSTYASGAIYLGDPTLQNICGLLGTSAISQQPKSMTATRLLTSGLVLNSTLSGLRSRCTMLLLRICLYPSKIWRKMRTASSSGMPLGVRLRYQASVPPSSSSVTRQIQFS